MYSPRIDFVYNLSAKDTIKFGYNRSVRHSDDADLYSFYQAYHKYCDVENIDTLEIIYNFKNDYSRFDLSVFYNDHDVVAFNDTQKITQNIGNVKSYGFEIEYSYKQNRYELYISHSYAKLKDFKLSSPYATRQNISAMPYGYGDDFANWNDHITKLRFDYKIDKKLKWTNSLRVFWGMPGAKDLADYNINLDDNIYKLPYYEDGHTRAFKESVYLNSGLVWNLNRQTTLTLNGYNLLGIIDEDYNKRNFFQRTSHYVDQAPSISIGVRYLLD
jgi:hypothetical protein